MCQVCGTIQNVDCVKPGDKLIYYPTNIREEQELIDYCNTYKFYPGMEVTAKEIVEHPTTKGLLLLKVEETDLLDIGFIAADLRLKQFITEKIRQERFIYYLRIWHRDKYPFFTFRKGQKVKFSPSYITLVWYKNEPLFTKLINNQICIITKTINRRYLWLADVPLNIYWKDVKKIV